MKAKKYSEEQIIGALQEADAGAKVEDVCWRLGISKVTFYRWKAKFSGLQVSSSWTGSPAPSATSGRCSMATSTTASRCSP